MFNNGTSTELSDRAAKLVTALRQGSVTVVRWNGDGTSTGFSDRHFKLIFSVVEQIETSIRFLSILNTLFSNKEIASPVRAKLSSPRRSCLTLSE